MPSDFQRCFFLDLKVVVLQEVGKGFPRVAAPYRETNKPLGKFQINSNLYSCIIRVYRCVSTCSHSVIFRTGTHKQIRDFLCYSYCLWKSVELILSFVERAALYNLVNKDNLVQFFLVRLFLFSTCFIPRCITDSHSHRIASNKCRIDTVISPDDGHIVARNM